MGYLDTLSSSKLKNAAILNDHMIANGITNAFARAAVLAVVAKESGFTPKSENSYKNTSNARIREVFPKLASLNDAQLNTLKANDTLFFNAVYGGKYGNAANEGYKYRGRGYNQLTFKGNYADIGKRVGVDLVSNPDKANDPAVAADIVIAYYLREFTNGKKYLAQFNTDSINGFKSLMDALKAVNQATIGWATDPNKAKGFQSAASKVDDLYAFVTGGASAVKKNAGKIVLTVVLLAAAGWTAYKYA